MPGGMYPPGAPFPPPPKKKRTGLWVALGIVGVLLLIVIAGGVARVLVSSAQGGGVTDTSDVDAGECIVVTAEPETLKADEVSCGDTDFHYLVAEKSITQGLCGPNYSRYWVAGEEGALCLAPVYQERAVVTTFRRRPVVPRSPTFVRSTAGRRFPAERTSAWTPRLRGSPNVPTRTGPTSRRNRAPSAIASA